MLAATQEIILSGKSQSITRGPLARRGEQKGKMEATGEKQRRRERRGKGNTSILIQSTSVVLM